MKIYKDILYNREAREMDRLDIWAPEGPTRTAYMYIHGGGLTHGDKYSAASSQLFQLLVSRGIAVFSVNYRFLPVTDHDSCIRKYPVESAENDVDFPVFIEDCAKAFRWIMKQGREYVNFDNIFIGGSSAGAYIAMMLYFDRHYLADVGYDSETNVKGYVFDSGQPTTHFHLLELRNESPLRITVDEAAPFFYVDHKFEKPYTESMFGDVEEFPRLMFVTAEQDMPGRVEQNELFIATLKNLNYHEDRITYLKMKGFRHCAYLADPRYTGAVAEFLTVREDLWD